MVDSRFEKGNLMGFDLYSVAGFLVVVLPAWIILR